MNQTKKEINKTFNHYLYNKIISNIIIIKVFFKKILKVFQILQHQLWMNYSFIHNLLKELCLTSNLVLIFRRFQLFKTVIKTISFKIRIINLIHQLREDLKTHNVITLKK